MAVRESHGMTPIYYHCNDPTIEQTFMISLPNDLKDMETVHLWFGCTHASTNTKQKDDERGFAYLPLFHGKTQQFSTSRVFIVTQFFFIFNVCLSVWVCLCGCVLQKETKIQICKQTNETGL